MTKTHAASGLSLPTFKPTGVDPRCGRLTGTIAYAGERMKVWLPDARQSEQQHPGRETDVEINAETLMANLPRPTQETAMKG